jgi:cell wall-associated NlpC family hydrolase
MFVNRITAHDLRPADLLVSRSNTIASLAVRLATGAEVSHASLYIRGGMVGESSSEGGGVRKSPLAESIRNSSLVDVYRRPGLSTHLARCIAMFAESQVGYGYNGRGAVNTHTLRAHPLIRWIARGVVKSDRGRFYCSQLVLEAFRHNGVCLAHSPGSSEPGDIPNAFQLGELEYVGRLRG